MEPAFLQWAVSFALLTVVYCVFLHRHGPHRALGVVVALSYLFPTWTALDVMGLPFNLRVCSSLLGLTGICVFAGRSLFNRLTALDLALIVMATVHLASDLKAGDSFLPVLLRLYGEWGIPYLAGRYALREREDLQFLAPVLCFVLLVWGAFSIIETAAGFNVYETVYELRPEDGFARDTTRMDMKRAYGAARHPIYWGTLFLLLLPWSVQMLKAGETWTGRLGGGAALVSGIVGCLASLSRGPIVGLFLWPFCWLATRSLKSFFVMLALLVVATGLVAANYNSVNEWIHAMGGEKAGGARKKVEIEGQEISYSATNNRWMILYLYGPIIPKLGPLGAGTEATSEFPVNVPFLPASAKTLKTAYVIDNAFLLMGLRFGWVGLLIFVLLYFVGVYQFVSLTSLWDVKAFASATAAMLLSFFVVLWTVWLHVEIGFVYLWTLGLSTALICADAGYHRSSSRRERIDVESGRREQGEGGEYRERRRRRSNH